MRFSRNSRLVACLVALTFFVATFRPFIAYAMPAEPCAMSMATSSTDPSHHKGMVPACAEGTSCIISVAIPETFVPSARHLVWARVQYTHPRHSLVSIAIPPERPPPIPQV